MDRCPNCGKTVPSGLKQCPECGYRFSFVHRALDRFGGSIPDLFQAVYNASGGDDNKIIATALSFVAVIIYTIIVILMIVIPCAALSMTIFNLWGKVTLVQVVIAVLSELAAVVYIMPMVSLFIEKWRDR